MSELVLPDDAATKQEWRTWAKQARQTADWPALSEATCIGLGGFPPFLHAETILTYLPMDNEIDLRRLMDAADTKRWIVTRTPEEGPLTLHVHGGATETHRYGFEQPIEGTAEVAPDTIDLALVPGLAFDLFGNRLGRGAGYYDRLLPLLKPGAVLVGVTPEALVVDRLPSEIHDVRVHWLAAEEGVVGVAH